MADETTPETPAVEPVKSDLAPAPEQVADAEAAPEPVVAPPAAEEPAAEQDEQDDKPVDPVAYTAPHDVFLDNVYTKAGDVFVTSLSPEESWVERKPDEVAAINAATQDLPADTPYENLDVAALQAIAVIKHVNVTGIESDKDALITAIKAAQVPQL